MAQVWVGYSSNLGFRDLIVANIDPFFAPVEDEDDPVARLVQDFGADPIGPGDFEAHERTDKALTPGAFLDSVPFSVPASELNGQDCPACLSSSYKTFLNSKISDGISSYLKFSYIHPYESTLHDYSLDRSISSRAPPKA